MKSAFSLTLRIAILVGLAGTIPGTAQASDWDRSALLDGPGSPKAELQERGITVDAWLTQFYQGIIAGEGDQPY